MALDKVGTKKIKKLTPKQQKFVDSIVSGKNPSEAYRQAYNTSANNNTIAKEAQNILKNPNISPIIEQRKTEIQEKINYTTRDSFLNLELAQSESLNQGNINAYIKAEELKGKLLGLYTEKKEVDVGLKAIQVIFDEKCKGL